MGDNDIKLLNVALGLEQFSIGIIIKNKRSFEIAF